MQSGICQCFRSTRFLVFYDFSWALDVRICKNFSEVIPQNTVLLEAYCTSGEAGVHVSIKKHVVRYLQCRGIHIYGNRNPVDLCFQGNDNLRRQTDWNMTWILLFLMVCWCFVWHLVWICPLADVVCLLLEGHARLLGTALLKGHTVYVYHLRHGVVAHDERYKCDDN